MEDSGVIATLRQALRICADDHRARRELVEHLLLEERLTEALEHVSFLANSLPEEQWPSTLGVAIARKINDEESEMAFHRTMSDTDSVEAELYSSRRSDESHKHPSTASGLLSRLQLVIGGSTHAIEVASPEVRLDDVAGIRTVRRNLRELIADAHGADVPSAGPWLGGLLLFGPPDCGKGFAAEMLAGELESALWTIDLSHAWSHSQLTRTFDDLIEKVSSEKIGVLHLKCVDNDEAPERLGFLYVSLDRARERAKLIIVASAIRPWKVTRELLNIKRASRVLLVLPPDLPLRSSFITNSFKGKATIATDDVDWLAKHTDGFSFDDLQTAVNGAIGRARNKTGSEDELPVIESSILKKVRAKSVSNSAEWLTEAAQHAMLSGDDGIYSDLYRYLRSRSHTEK